MLVGVNPLPIPIQIPQAQLSQSYHLEVAVADGLLITNPRFEDGPARQLTAGAPTINAPNAPISTSSAPMPEATPERS